MIQRIEYSNISQRDDFLERIEQRIRFDFANINFTKYSEKLRHKITGICATLIDLEQGDIGLCIRDEMTVEEMTYLVEHTTPEEWLIINEVI